MDKEIENVKNGVVSAPINDSLADVVDNIQQDMSIDNDVDSLLTLKKHVDALREQDRRLKFLDDKTKEQKKIRNHISQALIPDLLDKFNLSELKLGDSSRIVVKSDCSVTIKDEASFFKYLKDREEDDIIKRAIVVYKPDEELIKIIKNYIFKKDEESVVIDEETGEEIKEPTEMEFELTRKINTNTLKAYTRKRIEKGEELKLCPACKGECELVYKGITTECGNCEGEGVVLDKFPPESLSVFTFKSTKIK